MRQAQEVLLDLAIAQSALVDLATQEGLIDARRELVLDQVDELLTEISEHVRARQIEVRPNDQAELEGRAE